MHTVEPNGVGYNAGRGLLPGDQLLKLNESPFDIDVADWLCAQKNAAVQLRFEICRIVRCGGVYAFCDETS